MSDNVRNTDVFVIGAGNAAFCAPLAAREQGAQVVVLDVADEDEAHGNSRYAANQGFSCPQSHPEKGAARRSPCHFTWQRTRTGT